MKNDGGSETVHGTTPSFLNYWIGSEGSTIKVIEVCHVILSINKSYFAKVFCDVVDMDESHNLLG